ncbi:hypothetical protein [Halococcus dombrowskii]
MTPEAIDVDDGEGTSDRPTISQQYAFSVGEDGETDGAIEPSEESVETDLEAFGASVDHRERDTRIDQPEASSFGVDDRATVTRSDGGEQRALFADTDDDQQTLSGERAASQCLFESDDTGSDDRTSERAASANTDDETPRALADGGRVEDGESGESTNDGRERPTRSEHADFGGGEASGMDDLGDPAETVESEPQSDESTNDGHGPVKPENGHEDSEDSPRDNDNSGKDDSVNPHRHVPDEIDYITADGIEQVHEHLSDENAAIYAASSVEEQAAFLWKMVDQGVIDLSLRGR